MLSKCANPECSEQFRYLHQGKLFYLMPTPKAGAITDADWPQRQERFWLCESCSKTMTLKWGGTRVKLVTLPAEMPPIPTIVPEEAPLPEPSKRRAARAASRNR